MDCGLLLIPQKQRMFAFIINHLQSGKAICFLNDSDVQGCVHAHYCVEKCALLFHSLSQKPLMVIHHKDECPYSQALKKAFVANDTIQKMAKDEFVMINLVEEAMDKNLAPDGYYVPRILFVDPSLTVRADITGRYSNRHYAYAPEDIALLISNMNKAKVLLHNEL
uniref:Anterior gradient 1 n=1 Tax=Oryzias sinensis TaxID=183150 RepID=A0A8C7XNU6_9TELE